MIEKKFSPTDALLQLDEILTGITLEAYQHRCELIPGGTLGSHVRHCIEFYHCLFKGVRNGEVDYDARERNLEIEMDHLSAREEIRHLLQCKWPSIAGLSGDTKLQVRESLTDWQASSLSRELGFAFSHTIHHLAIIGVFLRDYGIHLKAEIGLAPSTTKHLALQAKSR